MTIKNLIFKFLPKKWYGAYVNLLNRRYRKMDTRQVFEEVYRKKLWSKKEFKQEDYHSGSGTTSQNTDRYISFLTRFLNENNVKRLVEIGCGDFRIMKQVLLNSSIDHYHGVDIVPNLIERNQNKYGISKKIEFSCLNAVTDDLPPGECLLIRQVLQHLNNEQIKAILAKTRSYKLVLITEHIPENSSFPNKDKAQGPETRLKDNSGIFIEKSPFNISKATTVYSYQEDYDFMGGVIPAHLRTSLVRNSAAESD